MKIKGIDGMTLHQLQDEVNRGGKFVMYTYCVSVVIMSFRRPTDIYFVKSGKSSVVKGLPWTFTSLLFGWWGIPWGIIYTFGALGTNLGGGKNVTGEVMNLVRSQANGGRPIDLGPTRL